MHEVSSVISEKTAKIRILIVAFLSFFFFDLLQKLYAKAIYDNTADSSDELAFKKGDILTVIEQDTEGIVGWWLCALHNRQVSRGIRADREDKEKK